MREAAHRSLSLQRLLPAMDRPTIQRLVRIIFSKSVSITKENDKGMATQGFNLIDEKWVAAPMAYITCGDKPVSPWKKPSEIQRLPARDLPCKREGNICASPISC